MKEKLKTKKLCLCVFFWKKNNLHMFTQTHLYAIKWCFCTSAHSKALNDIHTENKPRLFWMMRCDITECPPALCPNKVTLFGSPPNAAMLSCTWCMNTGQNAAHANAHTTHRHSHPHSHSHAHTHSHARVLKNNTRTQVKAACWSYRPQLPASESLTINPNAPRR